MDSHPDQTFLDITDIIAEARAERLAYLEKNRRIANLDSEIIALNRERLKLQKEISSPFIPQWRQKLDERLEQLINPPDLTP
jgi:hypothetical protein